MEAYGDGCCGGGLSFSAMQRVFLNMDAFGTKKPGLCACDD
jgi:hypothetical protein